MEAFKSLGLSEISLNAIKAKGFTEPSPVQVKAIPVMLASPCDVIVQAQTGTGKTAAFGLPILEGLKGASKLPQALIIAPTRELAVQVATEIESLAVGRKVRILTVYGGQSYTPQLRGLSSGTDIVVGTPGRIVDLLEKSALNLSNLSYLVLDEADEMLNMGFADDMETILSQANSDRRTYCFSATMPPRIAEMTSNFMKDPQTITIKKSEMTATLTDQIYFEVKEKDKFEALSRIIDMEHPFYGLVFCRTKADVDDLVNRLNARGFECDGLHGDIQQSQRERTLDKFKSRKISILIATDVAARGIDVANLTHVINFALPHDLEAYVHRIGRTGRAGNKGTAITFITPSEYRKLLFIQQKTKAEIRKATIPEVREIIRAKKSRITEEIAATVSMAGNETSEFSSWAEKLLEHHEAKTLVTALLKQSYEEELDSTSYQEISAPASRSGMKVDGRGTTRLYIASGRQDGLTERKIVNMIAAAGKIDERVVTDVKIFDNMSLATIPFAVAENVIREFAEEAKGRAPMVREDRGHSESKKSGSFRKESSFDKPRRDFSFDREPRKPRSRDSFKDSPRESSRESYRDRDSSRSSSRDRDSFARSSSRESVRPSSRESVRESLRSSPKSRGGSGDFSKFTKKAKSEKLSSRFGMFDQLN